MHFYVQNPDISQLLTHPPTVPHAAHPTGNFGSSEKEPVLKDAWPCAPEGSQRWPGMRILLC